MNHRAKSPMPSQHLALLLACVLSAPAMGEQVTTHRVDVNGATLEVRERGEGEPIVFVHGGMGDECAAIVTEPALVQNFRVIDYHRRGWGASEADDFPISIEEQAADCKAILDYLDIERAHFAGQSYGGIILLQFAQEYPDAANSLAVIEPGLMDILTQNPDFTQAFEKASGLYDDGDAAAALRAFGDTVCNEGFQAVFDETLPAGYMDRWIGDADTLFGDGPAVFAWQFTREDAQQIRQPTLNLRGEGTRPYFREVYERLEEWLPNAESQVVPNATHCVLQMNPEDAAEKLSKFFSKHPIGEP